MARRILFVINPAAGAGRAGKLWAAFERNNQEACRQGDRVTTVRSGEARGLVQRVAPDYDAIVAVGGDGSVFEVAGGILASGARDTALGIIPFGTGNDVAGALSIHNAVDARRAISTHQLRSIDVIDIDCLVEGKRAARHALLMASVGIGSEVLKRTTARVKQVFGQRLAYRIGLLRAIWTYQPHEMRVICDGLKFNHQFMFICASNSERAGGGMKIAPAARMNDGWLNMSLIEAPGRWETLMMIRRLCRGRHLNHPKVCYRPGISLEVESESPSDVTADGEIIGQTPARFKVKPAALKVLTP